MYTSTVKTDMCVHGETGMCVHSETGMCVHQYSETGMCAHSETGVYVHSDPHVCTVRQACVHTVPCW